VEKESEEIEVAAAYNSTKELSFSKKRFFS
jgi:hypothetical protein